MFDSCLVQLMFDCMFHHYKEIVGQHEAVCWQCFLPLLFLPPAVAEVGDSLGAPRLSVLPGLGDGSGRDGLLSNAGHQPLWTERVHTEMGSPLLLTLQPPPPPRDLSPPLAASKARAGGCSDAWARHVKVLRWGQLKGKFVEIFWFLFTEKKSSLSGEKTLKIWIKTSLKEKTHQKRVVCFVWRLKRVCLRLLRSLGESRTKCTLKPWRVKDLSRTET